MTRAAIYCRVSTDKQDKEGTSLETQAAACRAWATDRGYTLVGEPYIDVYTGTALRERPALMALFAALPAGKIDVVICNSIDRLSRVPRQLDWALEEADHHKVRFEFVTERETEDSDEGDLIRYVKGFAGKIEHARITERSKRGREQRARNGKPIPGGSAPLGYKWIFEETRNNPSGKPTFTVAGYELDPEKAQLARRIFEDIANGRSALKLAHDLTREGVPTQKGGARWYHSSIKTIINNPIYKGEYETLRKQYKTEKGKRGKSRVRPEAERVPIKGIAPAIVTPELWQAAQDQLTRNRSESARTTVPAETYLLRAGFIRCGYCGGSMVAGVSSTRHSAVPSYRCSPSNRHTNNCPGGGTIAAHILDAAVWSKVEAIRLHPEILLHEIERQVAEDDTTERDIAAIDDRLAQIEQNIAKTTRIVAQLDEAVSAQFIAKLNVLGKEKTALIAERTEAASRRAELLAGQSLLEGLWKKVDAGMTEAEAELANLTYQEKRQLLHRLGIKVKLWKTTHEPRFEITTAVDIRDFDPGTEPLPGPTHATPRWSNHIPEGISLGPIADRVLADSTSRGRRRAARRRHP